MLKCISYKIIKSHEVYKSVTYVYKIKNRKPPINFMLYVYLKQCLYDTITMSAVHVHL